MIVNLIQFNFQFQFIFFSLLNRRFCPSILNPSYRIKSQLSNRGSQVKVGGSRIRVMTQIIGSGSRLDSNSNLDLGTCLGSTFESQVSLMSWGGCRS